MTVSPTATRANQVPCTAACCLYSCLATALQLPYSCHIPLRARIACALPVVRCVCRVQALSGRGGVAVVRLAPFAILRCPHPLTDAHSVVAIGETVI